MKSIRRQKFRESEVIIVDNYSVDDTEALAEKFGARFLRKRGSQAAAKNFGLQHSRGKYILFLDSDQELQPETLPDCERICMEEAVDAVKIPEIFVGHNFWGRCSSYWKNVMVKAWGRKGGIPRFYRSAIFNGDNRFVSSLVFWEDLELYNRLKLKGLKTSWCRGGIIHHEENILSNVIRKYFSYGASLKLLVKRPSNVKPNETLKLTASTIKLFLRWPIPNLKEFLGSLIVVFVKVVSLGLGLLAAAFT